MFEFDLSKMVLFGAVALVVVGPRELPAALRLAGRVLGKLRRVQAEIRGAAETLMADASLDRELADLSNAARINLARDPATAMRGRLPAAGSSLELAAPEAEAMQYASPEMQAYLAPLPEAALAEAASAPLTQ